MHATIAAFLLWAPLDVEPEDLAPGLIAQYAAFSQIEARPSFSLGNSSPHPRVPPGPFEVIYTGALFVREARPIGFSAFVGGKVTLEIDGEKLLDSTSRDPAKKVEATKAYQGKAGLIPFKLTYQSLDTVPARLQVWWHGPGFAAEVIPPWRFSHLKEHAPKDHDSVKRGRDLAGKFGCARCHQQQIPSLDEPPPGPSLADAKSRLSSAWILHWLADPAKMHEGSRMPKLFGEDRESSLERWILAEHLGGKSEIEEFSGDHREGRKQFIMAGCIACHLVPDLAKTEQPDLNRIPLRGLGDKLPGAKLVNFLANPHGRYPDGRMPSQGLTTTQSRDIAAYLHLWSPVEKVDAAKAPTPLEIADLIRKLKARNVDAAAQKLLLTKGCAACHPGLGPTVPREIAFTKNPGCLHGQGPVRFHLSDTDRTDIEAYLKVAAEEKHPSPFTAKQRQIERAGCLKCHPRDSDRPPPLEVAASTLGGAYLQFVPFLRVPRLTNPHQKFLSAHLTQAVREGVTGLRHERFTFRMPAFGDRAQGLVDALAEADGELLNTPEPVSPPPTDPTAASLTGPTLVGFQGYACVSCHLWAGKKMNEPDPGAVGSDLTRVASRLRHDWFARFLEDPARFHPGTPMPGIFPHGQKAVLKSFFNGDPDRQKETLWHYFALGPNAPSPKPPPPLPISPPADGPLVAQIPIYPPGSDAAIESVTYLSHAHDLILYDLGSSSIHSVFVAGQIERWVQGRTRKYLAAGNEVPYGKKPGWKLIGKTEEPANDRQLESVEALPDGAMQLHWTVRFPSAIVTLLERINITRDRHVTHIVEVRGVPETHQLAIDSLGQTIKGRDSLTFRLALPEAKEPAKIERTLTTDPGPLDGSLERPGYRAFAYPRPKTVSGEDRVMPGAIVVHPRDGRVFVASMKLGELFVLKDPLNPKADFERYSPGLFQDALSMHAEEDGVYVLHRRNVSKLEETHRPGIADRTRRVLAVPHGVADTYDYGYGLVKDSTGAFVFGYAPYANRQLPGSGGAVRVKPGKEPEPIAYGFRNQVGWCTGPDGDIFVTDNQGEWVATNKLCHVAKGRYYGFPNPGQPEHAQKPKAKTTLWVPYGWAHSVNGVTYDNTGGKFGPFAGQFFLAELMYGGAIIRASLEKVDGEYQGVCFPFWGRGLLGPVTLAFDPSRGPLYVGSITEPGWMAQPDRGAVYRIDYTGDMPFEMRTIRVKPKGFTIHFTRPIDAKTGSDPAAYKLEHYRYEITGSYGSPELDRTAVKVESVKVASDGLSAELTLSSPLVVDRVYMIGAPGVRSPRGESLVHPTGAYTLNWVPKE